MEEVENAYKLYGVAGINAIHEERLSLRAENERLKAEIEELKKRALPEWQPIETAPRNSEMVLVMLPRMMNLVVRSWYNRLYNCWMSDRETEGGITKVEFYHKGDLWMPIPEPPAEAVQAAINLIKQEG